MTQSYRTLQVFHICSGYAGQALYPRLLSAIDAPGVEQFMYVPVRTAAEIDVGRITDNPAIGFRFEHLLRRRHKLMFRSKIRSILNDVMARTPVQDFSLVHAHFLYSDGAVALALHRQFNIPYIVAVRNADINAFMRLRPDLASIRNEVLRHASRVVFLSPAYAKALEQRLPAALNNLIAEKSIIVPNGLAPEWLNGTEQATETPSQHVPELRLLYVGDFTPNKNVSGIVAALEILRLRRPTTLTVVGGGGDIKGRVKTLLDAQRFSGVSYLGRITDSARLRDIYRSHDIFVMPSFHETFGMTYIEALSQGLPVVHSHGQGIDGYFAAGTVASSVNPADAQSIAEGILEVAARLPAVQGLCRDEARRFDLREIGKAYRDIYCSILGVSY